MFSPFFRRHHILPLLKHRDILGVVVGESTRRGCFSTGTSDAMEWSRTNGEGGLDGWISVQKTFYDFHTYSIKAPEAPLQDKIHATDGW